MLIELLLIVAVGFFAGLVNAIAGGGSLLTLPALIFLGLPSVEANATNRLAVLVQSFFSVLSLKNSGISEFRLSILPSIFAVLGSVVGFWIAIHISSQWFNLTLSIVMLLIAFLMIYKPKAEFIAKVKHKNPVAAVVFFLLGIYGGFIQAGIGVIMLILIPVLFGLNLVHSNFIKVFVNFVFTLFVLILFAYGGYINWESGIMLSVGMAFGGWFGSKWSVRLGHLGIQRVLVAVLVIMSARLFWISFIAV
ncbi:MAG: sulfite exporter TauE/SafE family protein [Chitinophagaceae bacterium]|nr:MAG: sulfite exporter TauE/SafE family protein [Chitinophagaceae bacterium]